MSEQTPLETMITSVPKAKQGEDIELQKEWGWVEAAVWTGSDAGGSGERSQRR